MSKLTLATLRLCGRSVFLVVVIIYTSQVIIKIQRIQMRPSKTNSLISAMTGFQAE